MSERHIWWYCLFSAPIPTSSFIRVPLCICGMACHDMTWPRLSIRWKRGAYSSHLMCRQRATHNRAAMRAAYLVLMALGEDKMSLQFLECLLCHVWHLNIPLTCLVAYCVLIGSWVTLGLTCRLTIFLVGQRILSMGMVFLLSPEPHLYRARFAYQLIRSYKGAWARTLYSTMQGSVLPTCQQNSP